MRNFLRLLRYGLPYTLEWLPGVILSALVGGLDAFRILLLQPIFDRVLTPSAPEGPIMLGLPNTPWHFDLRRLFRTSCICTTHGSWWRLRWSSQPF